MKKIARSVGRRNPASIARQVLAHGRVRKGILANLCKVIKKEVACMCRNSASSILQDSSPTALQSFNWETLISELNNRAPTLLQLLRGAINTKRCQYLRKSRTYRVPDAAIVGMCSAIILRHKSHKMNLVQRLLSTILYMGHTNTLVCLTPIFYYNTAYTVIIMINLFMQVFDRLQKLHLCLSHRKLKQLELWTNLEKIMILLYVNGEMHWSIFWWDFLFSTIIIVMHARLLIIMTGWSWLS